MALPDYQEKKSFYIYIGLVYLTAFLFLKFQNFEIFSGLILIVWGLFGFYRYLYLNQFFQLHLPKILTLPSRILFSFDQIKQDRLHHNLDRFLNTDFILFFLLSIFYMGWGVYNCLNPADSVLINSFWENKDKTLLDFSYYPILKNLSYFFMMGLIFFSGMTYDLDTKKIVKFLFIFLIAIFFYFLFSSTLANIKPYFEFSSLKGIGWGQFYIFENLASEKILNSSSSFLKRYIETGIIGAYGLYFIFIPMTLSFIFSSRFKGDVWARVSCLIVLIILMALDYFYIFNFSTMSIQILAMSYLACFWGKTIRA